MLRPLTALSLAVLLTLATLAPAVAGSPAAPTPATPCSPTAPNADDAPGMDSPGWHWYQKGGLYASVSSNSSGNYEVTYVEKNGHPGAKNWNKQFWVAVPDEPISVTLDFLGSRTTTPEPQITLLPSSHGSTPFQNSIIWFPESGCWRFTMSTPTRSLQVDVLVVIPDAPATATATTTPTPST